MQSTGRMTLRLKKLSHYSYDTCSKCGAKLPRGAPAYAGYSAAGDELYVGECCISDVSELASHIYWWWESYKRPAPTTKLLRYMDFAKFVAMLRDRALHFARGDTLGDKFEGARGIAERWPEWRDHCLSWFQEAIRSLPGGAGEKLSEGEVQEKARELLAQFQSTADQAARRSFVSCWHAAEEESEALWRLYTPSPMAGVAVSTTFGELDASLDQSTEIKFGHVQYVDYTKGFAGTYDRMFWKRASLRHEMEVRGVIEETDRPVPEPERGKLVGIDLSRAIKAVIISPFAPEWFDTLLADMLKRFEVKAPLRRSGLLAEPFF